MNIIFNKNLLSEESAALITEELMQLFYRHGDADYDGEPVSQASHMIQCGMRAIDNQADQELVLGAFLHDIGHLLKHGFHINLMDGYGVVDHEKLGAQYLQERGFSDRVCAVVEMHVQAKRYLVSTDSGYKKKLSEASLQTLQWQGGMMNEDEINVFRKHPHFDEIIKVRIWDEEAKDANASLLPLNFFHRLILTYLKERSDATANRTGSI